MDATVDAAFESNEILETDQGKYASGIHAI
jgi:hypothetical protein